ncbi:MAG: MBL fold metallo-hydrolase, partial [Anaerolineae bacterium]|nr:MBL fold metallo-hydrolase [Anaerolineae bacterium]
GPANCGVVLGRDGQAVVVDSGVGSRSGRRIAEALAARGWRPVAVCNTHVHGDHAGGNAYLAREVGARVYVPAREAALAREPGWNGLFLFGGAHPVAGTTTRKLAPEPSPVHGAVCEGTLHLAGLCLEAISLPGHTGGHMGYLVDGVCFLGDALASEQELAWGLPYVHSVSLKLRSLERLAEVQAAWYVPGHGDPRREVTSLIQANRKAIHDLLDALRASLAEGPRSGEEVVAWACRWAGVWPKRVGDLGMVRATVLAHLSHLHEAGEVAYEVRDGRLVWRLADRPTADQAGV